MANLQPRVAALESKVAQLTAELHSQSSSPDPPIYSGNRTTHPISLHEWVDKMAMKLDSMQDVSNKHKIYYIAGRTTGAAYDGIKDRMPIPGRNSWQPFRTPQEVLQAVGGWNSCNPQ